MKILCLLPLLIACVLTVVPSLRSDPTGSEVSKSRNTGPPHSLDADKEFYSSGTAFLSVCSAVDRVKGKQQSSTDLADARACQSYVRGVVDGVTVQHIWSRSHGDPSKAAFCVQFEKLPPVQIVDAVLRYLRDNPDKQRFDASIAVEEVLHNRFPCRIPSDS